MANYRELLTSTAPLTEKTFDNTGQLNPEEMVSSNFCGQAGVQSFPRNRRNKSHVATLLKISNWQRSPQKKFKQEKEEGETRR